MGLYLGVDGGGTTTAFCLVRGASPEQVHVVARHTGPTSYYFGSAEGIGLVERVLADGVAAVCRAAGCTAAEIDQAFFGLPGYGEVHADVRRLDELPRRVLGHGRYACDNDMVCGWAGSLRLADGVNVVAGTGSIAYGRRGLQEARVGGWGEVFGDEGSGYWLAVNALRVASQMSDGRREPGPLLEVLRDHLGLRTDLDLVDVVLQRWDGDRTRIAALSRPVVVAARSGDHAARSLLAAAAEELARHVTAVRSRLRFPADELVPVSYSGGVFAVDEVRDRFVTALERAPEPYAVRTPVDPPDLGAARWAARLAPTGPVS